MGFKENLQKRIEKNAVKSILTYEDEGQMITEEVLLKRSKLPLIGDWARIYPPLNEDGSWNFMNAVFGGKKNLMKLIGIFLVLCLLFYWVNGILGANREYMNGDKYIIIERPLFEKYCSQVSSDNSYNELNELNMSIFRLKE